MILANTITSGNLVGCHGIFLNLFIGIFEAWLLSILFKANKKRIKLRMIAANYTSYFLGFFIFPCANYLSQNIDLFSVKLFVLTSFLVFLIVTILIEWPFIIGAFKDKTKPVLSALLASVIVQIISYVMLAPFYFIIGRYGLLLTTHVERQLDFVQQQNVSVYYFSDQDGFVYRLDLDTMESDLMSDTVQYEGWSDELYTDQNQDTGKWDLFASLDRKKDGKSSQESILIAEGVSDQPSGRRAVYTSGVDRYITDYRTEPKSQIKWIGLGGSGRGFLIGNNPGGFIATGLDTPFITWDSGVPTILPGDQIVFELHRQICIVDCKTRKIGLLVKGSSPVTCIDPKAKE